MPKYKATAYIRLSYTDDHSSESDSVSNQRKLIENFVERNPDIEVVSEKIDDGYSGWGASTSKLAGICAGYSRPTGCASLPSPTASTPPTTAAMI